MMTDKYIKCMLAEPLDDKARAKGVTIETLLRDWGGKVQGEGKYDGMRLRMFRIDGEKRIFSRPSAKLPNGTDYTDQLPHIVAALPDDWDNYLADGELFTGSWGETMHLARSSPGSMPPEERMKLKGLLFDFVDLEQVEASGCDPTPLFKRRQVVEDVAKKSNGVFTPVESRIISDPEELDAYYREMLEQGLEGLILKDPKSAYYPRRKRSWMKLKPTDTSEGIVVGFTPGTGKHEGRLGACVLDWNGVKVKCGGGFKDKQRDWIWTHQQQVIGAPLEFVYQPDNVAKARFLRFKRFRFDMMPDATAMTGFPK
jgi:DNA ligase-1